MIPDIARAVPMLSSRTVEALSPVQSTRDAQSELEQVFMREYVDKEDLFG